MMQIKENFSKEIVSKYLLRNKKSIIQNSYKRQLQEECGIFGICDHNDSSSVTAIGLHALQHRGQEGAGIVSFDNISFHMHRDKGLVSEIFSKKKYLEELKGDISIGHLRYATTGDNSDNNIQPFFADINKEGFAVAHNGQLTNYHSLRSELSSSGSIFQTSSDSELFLHLTSLQNGNSLIEKFLKTLDIVKGGFAIVAISKDYLIGARDSIGIRQLVCGMLDDAPVFASETCALDAIGARFIREVNPGECLIFERNKKKFFSIDFQDIANKITKIDFEKLENPSSHASYLLDSLANKDDHKIRKAKPCVFEIIYFSKPNSVLGNKNIYAIRKNLGRQLARETGLNADIVSPIPDSGVPSAIGYAEEINGHYDMALIRSHFIGRSFIEPNQNQRKLAVAKKHLPNNSIIRGKEIILIDDSIVRGTTISKIISLCRRAGAKKIHICVTSPPVKFPDYYGINTPSFEELIASNREVKEIKEMIGADSLNYLSVKGLYKAIEDTNNILPFFDENEIYHPFFELFKSNKNIDQQHNYLNDLTDHCFTGNYPTTIPENIVKSNDKPTQLSLLNFVSKV